jgi:hypothetical protein
MGSNARYYFITSSIMPLISCEKTIGVRLRKLIIYPERLAFIVKNLNTRHILKDESARLGIKHGWYGTRVNGTLMTGPSDSEEACLAAISALPEPVVKAHR